VRAADEEFVAVALVRPDDFALLPAWLRVREQAGWDAVVEAVARVPACEVVARGAELGLAVARRGEVRDTNAVVTSTIGDAPPLARPPVVVDLSSLWAGPLATRLLRDAGARVIKVESIARPDGARDGDPRFFDLMHAGKESVGLDFRSAEGVAQLGALLRAADVVVEASRPRALAQLGIDATAWVRDGPRVWCSITGYGRASNRVAFGDDAAVAGGLVSDDAGGPCFVVDAIADPLGGMVAAAAVLDALHGSTRVVLDVALARVAASVARAGGGEPWRAGGDARPPVAPAAKGRAPALGEHTAAVLCEFGA
jgi:crotonobetainyl-CoA:carnitine CoA-transferase CaiB-like acyl-CoA transferase